MNVNEVRQIIRESIRLKLKEHATKSKSPPSDFGDFKRKFVGCLDDSGAPRALVEEVDGMDSDDGVLFEKLWSDWSDIKNELNTAKTIEEKRTLWGELVEFYLYGTVYNLLEEQKGLNFQEMHKVTSLFVSKMSSFRR